MLDQLFYYVRVIVFITGSLSVVGCVTYTDTLEVRSQVIDITSNPTGAHITMADENGTRSLGETPTQLDADYTVTQRTYDKASCALAGAGAVSSAMSDNDDDDDEMSDVEAILGIVGLFAGAAAGAAACAEADGVVAIYPHTIGLKARLEGYHTQEVVIVVPKEKPLVHFEMVPQNRSSKPKTLSQGNHTAPIRSATTDEAEQPRVVVLNVATSVEEIGPELVESLSAFLTEEIADSGRFVAASREALKNLQNNGASTLGECSDVACSKRIARALRAKLVVETRIVKRKSHCFVAMSLVDSEKWDLELLAATKSSCDEDGLTEAMEVVAGILTSPPATEVGLPSARSPSSRP